MRAIKIHNYGSFEQLKYEETEIPEVANNQVLVKIHATSINHLDMKKASGGIPVDLPWIPGHDFAGTVELIGKEVKGFRIGERVYGNCPGGSYAEFVAADIDKVVKMPEELSFIEASSVPHVGETAWQAIHTHGQLKAGQKVLVHGAAGAVGAFAVQFAHKTGATVYATAAAEDMELVKAYGADEVIDYKTQDFTKEFQGVDLVIMLVGGDTEERSYTILKDGGRLVSTIGIAHKEIAEIQNITAIPMVIQQSAKDLEKITELINSGDVKTDIAVVYPMDQVVKAWKNLSGDPSLPKVTHGKIVLQIISE